jgi:hypothetical protein
MVVLKVLFCIYRHILASAPVGKNFLEIKIKISYIEVQQTVVFLVMHVL